MLNNKGQSLVLFILLIPILLGIMALVIDVGMIINEKNEMDNKIEFVLEYGLDQIDTEINTENMEIEENTLREIELDSRQKDLEVLLNYNLKDNQNTLSYEEDKIIISSETYAEGIFSNLLNFKGFQIKSSYQGYWDNGKKVIKKVI